MNNNRFEEIRDSNPLSSCIQEVDLARFLDRSGITPAIIITPAIARYPKHLDGEWQIITVLQISAGPGFKPSTPGIENKVHQPLYLDTSIYHGAFVIYQPASNFFHSHLGLMHQPPGSSFQWVKL